jgi:hypothetical protein
MMGLLKPESPGVETVVTVVNGIDLDVVVGRKPGIPVDRIGDINPN